MFQMPAIAESAFVAVKSSRFKKEKKVKSKKAESCDSAKIAKKERKAKKEKKEKKETSKSSKKSKATVDEDEIEAVSSRKEKKEKSKSLKKSKATVDGDEIEAVSLAFINEQNSIKEKKRKHREEVSVPSKKSKSNDGEAEPVDAAAVTSFRVNPRNVAALAAQGITSLFPIQTHTFDVAFEGHDLIARARTGSGKTLAFALPIAERLLAADTAAQASGERVRAYGRAPRVLVVAPTRELARQVATVFKSVGCGLAVALIYGGAAYGPQEAAIRRGIDVLVGTPGRINDFLEKKDSLNLSKLECIILDEADEMLNIGFAKEIERMLETVPDRDHRQMLLFSATIPKWVDTMVHKYLKPTKHTVDLVGEEKRQASADVQHMSMPVYWSEKAAVINDCIKLHSGRSGRTIVFAPTKNECNELVLDSRLTVDCQVLHGDIAQAQREVTLQGFRDGKFQCLVATDVAARGLDISGVDLVIQTEPPTDVETYIHRSGRTGRAGKKGRSITLYTPKHVFFMQQISRKAGVAFQLTGCPQPLDLLKVAAADAIEVVDQVPSEVMAPMMESARQLIAAKGAEAAVAACLFAASGMKADGAGLATSRSLLTGQTHLVTLDVLLPRPAYSASPVWKLLEQVLSADTVAGVKGLRLRADGRGAVVDVPATARDEVLALPSSAGVTLAESLPDIVERAVDPPAHRFQRGGGRSGGWAGGRQRGSGGRGGRYAGNGGRYAGNGGRYAGNGGRYAGNGGRYTGNFRR